MKVCPEEMDNLYLCTLQEGEDLYFNTNYTMFVNF